MNRTNNILIALRKAGIELSKDKYLAMRQRLRKGFKAIVNLNSFTLYIKPYARQPFEGAIPLQPIIPPSRNYILGDDEGVRWVKPANYDAVKIKCARLLNRLQSTYKQEATRKQDGLQPGFVRNANVKLN